MTAREQARRAAGRGKGSIILVYRQEGADAASDVWEPIVRDLLEYFDLACLYASPPVDRIIENLEAARKRAKEALG